MQCGKEEVMARTSKAGSLRVSVRQWNAEKPKRPTSVCVYDNASGELLLVIRSLPVVTSRGQFAEMGTKAVVVRRKQTKLELVHQ